MMLWVMKDEFNLLTWDDGLQAGGELVLGRDVMHAETSL